MVWFSYAIFGAVLNKLFASYEFPEVQESFLCFIYKWSPVQKHCCDTFTAYIYNI